MIQNQLRARLLSNDATHSPPTVYGRPHLESITSVNSIESSYSGYDCASPSKTTYKKPLQ